MEEFKYLVAFFKSERRTEQEIDRWIGEVSLVMRILYGFSWGRDLGVKVKLIYWLIYVLTFTYDHEL